MRYPDPNDSYSQYSLPYQPTYTPGGERSSAPAYPASQAPRQAMARPQAAPRPRQNNSAPPRMPKAEALSLVRNLKRLVVIASVAAFGAIGGLALGHVTGVTSQPANSIPTQQTTPTSPSNNNGGFFQQQGGTQFGSGSSSVPVTSSHTS